MRSGVWACLILNAVAGAALAADAPPVPIVPDTLRVNDQSRADGHNGKNFNLCGMHVRAHATLPSGSSIEWEVSVNVLISGHTQVAGVSVGSFAVPPQAKVRVPRAPIRDLYFTIEDSADRTAANFFGNPNSDNGVVGQIPEASALQFFDALDAGTAITVHSVYDNGDREALVLRARGVQSAPGGHGSAAPVHLCLAHLVPPDAGTTPLVEHPHPGS